MRLDDETVDRLAHRVVELLNPDDERPEETPPSKDHDDGRLLSPAQVAAWWNIDRKWIYDHADELGVLRLGTGPRPRLRFDPDKVRRRLALPKSRGSQDHASSPRTDARRSPRIPGDSRELLPFRADTELSSNDPKKSRSGAQTAPPTRARRTARSTR